MISCMSVIYLFQIQRVDITRRSGRSGDDRPHITARFRRIKWDHQQLQLVHHGPNRGTQKALKGREAAEERGD